MSAHDAQPNGDLPDSPVIDVGFVPPDADDSLKSAATCTYQGKSYAAGTELCVNKRKCSCNSKGEWIDLGKSC